MALDIFQLTQPDIQSFIREHERDDPGELMLRGSHFPGIPMREVVMQIQARQKARLKLPEWYQTPGIIFPPALSVEQASSEQTARFKAGLLSGQKLVDLTGGMGVDSYYLGHAFKQVHYVEQQPNLVSLAEHNFHQLGAENITSHQADANDFLEKLPEKVDCIYLDPARRDEHARKVFRLQDCSPDITELQSLLLSKAEQVLIKTAPLLDIQAAIREISHVRQVWVVAYRNECKEVLYLMEANPEVEPTISTVNLQEEGNEAFEFRLSAEAGVDVRYSQPKSFIYEPNAAILKAGAFRSLAGAFAVNKLHPNSHLYTSDELLPDFPGRIFSVEAVSPYSRKSLKKLLPGNKANITVRNFPESVSQIRKKTGWKDGGEIYIFATTDPADKPVLVLCRKQY
jgi:16S rRNA G966 N2-methylase RsmD